MAQAKRQSNRRVSSHSFILLLIIYTSTLVSCTTIPRESSQPSVDPIPILREARTVADSIEDTERKAWLLKLTGDAQFKAGDREGAVATLRAASDAGWERLLSLEPGYDYRFGNATNALVNIAKSQVKAGDRDGAETTLGRGDSSFLRARFELGFMTMDEYNEAQKYPMLKMKPDPHPIEETLNQSVEQILRTAGSIENPYNRAIFLKRAARSRIESDLDAAEEMSLAISGYPAIKIEALLSVADARILSGDRLRARGILEDCVRLLKSVKPENRDIVRPVARLQVATGDLEGALETAGIIGRSEGEHEESGPGSGAKLELVSELWLQSGNEEKALQTAEQIRDESRQGSAYQGIAWAQAKSGRMEEAIQTLDRIPSSQAIIVGVTLRSLAYHLAEKGDLEQSNLALEKARAVFDKTGFPGEIEQFMPSLSYATAKGIAAQGHIDRALEWARSQDTPDRKAFALLGVTDELLESDK
jgi:tetratricopeptide (TPR) repeat protein